METPSDNVAFSIGGLDIYCYAIMITLGLLLAFALVTYLLKKRGIGVEFALELFLWVVILAVVCCRLFYVVPRIGTTYDLTTAEGWAEIFNLRQGGLTIIGGIFGGVIGIIGCCLRNKMYSIARTADLVVLALFVGQIVGRWGNYFNQELYGLEITDPSMQWFPFAVHVVKGNIDLGWHCALFFYEGVLNFIGLCIGLTMFRYKIDKRKPLMIGIFYLLWYGIVRGSLEFLKMEHATFPGTEVGIVQVICYCMAAACAVLIILYAKGIINFRFLDKYNKAPNPDCTAFYNVDGNCEVINGVTGAEEERLEAKQ